MFVRDRTIVSLRPVRFCCIRLGRFLRQRENAPSSNGGARHARRHVPVCTCRRPRSVGSAARPVIAGDGPQVTRLGLAAAGIKDGASFLVGEELGGIGGRQAPACGHFRSEMFSKWGVSTGMKSDGAPAEANEVTRVRPRDRRRVERVATFHQKHTVATSHSILGRPERREGLTRRR